MARWVAQEKSHYTLAFKARWCDHIFFFRRTAKNLVAYATSWSLTLSPASGCVKTCGIITSAVLIRMWSSVMLNKPNKSRKNDWDILFSLHGSQRGLGFDLDRKLNPWLKVKPNFLAWLPNGKIGKTSASAINQGSKLTTNWLHMRLDFWLCA